MITHSIPGRIRVRHATPLTEDALNTLTSDIRKLAPSARVEHNPETCGTLIVFEEKDASVENKRARAAILKKMTSYMKGILAWNDKVNLTAVNDRDSFIGVLKRA